MVDYIWKKQTELTIEIDYNKENDIVNLLIEAIASSNTKEFIEILNWPDLLIWFDKKHLLVKAFIEKDFFTIDFILREIRKKQSERLDAMMSTTSEKVINLTKK